MAKKRKPIGETLQSMQGLGAHQAAASEAAPVLISDPGSPHHGTWKLDPAVGVYRQADRPGVTLSPEKMAELQQSGQAQRSSAPSVITEEANVPENAQAFTDFLARAARPSGPQNSPPPGTKPLLQPGQRPAWATGQTGKRSTVTTGKPAAKKPPRQSDAEIAAIRAKEAADAARASNQGLAPGQEEFLLPPKPQNPHVQRDSAEHNEQAAKQLGELQPKSIESSADIKATRKERLEDWRQQEEQQQINLQDFRKPKNFGQPADKGLANALNAGGVPARAAPAATIAPTAGASVGAAGATGAATGGAAAGGAAAGGAGIGAAAAGGPVGIAIAAGLALKNKQAAGAAAGAAGGGSGGGVLGVLGGAAGGSGGMPDLLKGLLPTPPPVPGGKPPGRPTGLPEDQKPPIARGVEALGGGTAGAKPPRPESEKPPIARGIEDLGTPAPAKGDKAAGMAEFSKLVGSIADAKDKALGPMKEIEGLKETLGIEDPLKKFAKGTLAAGAALVGLVKGIDLVSDAQLENARRLQQHSGTIAESLAMRDRAEALREVGSAGRTEDSVAMLAQASDEMKDELQPIYDTLTRILNIVLTYGARLVTAAVEVAKHIPGLANIEDVLDAIEENTSDKHEADSNAFDRFWADSIKASGAPREPSVPFTPRGELDVDTSLLPDGPMARPGGRA